MTTKTTISNSAIATQTQAKPQPKIRDEAILPNSLQEPDYDQEFSRWQELNFGRYGF